MIILLPSQLAQQVRQPSLREPALQPQVPARQHLPLQLQARPRAKRVDGQVAATAPSSVSKRVHTKKPDGLADSAVAVSAEKAGE